MNFDDAVRLTEILLGLALLQQSLEHMAGKKADWPLFLTRSVLSIFLVAGAQMPWACLGLLVLGLLILKGFQGPYNGGSDRMGLLVLCCLCLVHFLPAHRWKEMAFGYMALQLVLSYFIAGWVKLKNPDWRTGRALGDVFLFSAYPTSEAVRTWAQKPRLMAVMSWAVIGFELLVPFSMATPATLMIALAIATCFHLANACLFGLNRFFWVWLAAYPSLLWLQQRVFL